MKPTRKPRVKICCIKTIEEAWIAINEGASAIGFVSEMPSGPGVISEEEIAEISVKIPPPVSRFLLTCKQDVDLIIKQQEKCKVNAIQICDRLKRGTHKDLKDALPGVSIVQVVHVHDVNTIEEAIAVALQVDAILLDSGNRFLPVKELGGTGKTHDWNVSKIIRELVDVPVFLAGGLKPDNIAKAIRQVRPFAVDVCSGVRTEGKLDEIKLAEFFHQISTVV